MAPWICRERTYRQKYVIIEMMKKQAAKSHYQIDLDQLLLLTGWDMEYVCFLLCLSKEEKEILKLKTEK